MCALLALAWFAGAAFAHEPYLLVTANEDGTFTAEAGYSDGLSVEGLTLRVRDRATGELIVERRFPADGFLTLPRPAAPYRVEFDGGPGHRLLKSGPEPEVTAATPMPAQKGTLPDSPAPAPTAASSFAAADPAASKPRPEAAVASANAGETTRIALIVGIFFLFGAVAFALGFSAGRRSP